MTDERVGAAGLPLEASRDGGRYTLLSLLGRGSMGEVYLARDERLRRQVAIKRIRAAGDNEERLRARLEQEAGVLAQLGHPAIVAVFDIFEDADGAWVVMELVVGRTLAKVQGERALDVDDALAHGIAIAAALDSAHQKGIVHRDLKVENVMLSESGQVKILDFGLAKRLSPSESSPALSVEGQVMGTVRTMSPEQARGLAVDHRSDLFSLGVLLYEVLSGQWPFAAATELDTLARVSTHRQPSLVELPGLAEVIPAALSELVDELLEKAVEQRPQSAAEVRERLAAIALARPARRGPARATPARGHRAALEQSTDAPSAVAASAGDPAAAASAGDPAAAEAAGAATVRLKPKPASSAAGAPRDQPRAALRYVLVATLCTALAVPLAVRMLGTDAASGSGRAGDPGNAVPAAPPHGGGAPVRDPKAEYERGMALLRNFHRPGAIDEAAGIFQRLLRENERSAPGYAGLARAYWRKYAALDVSKDPQILGQARSAADRAVALDERFVDARVSRGLVLLELGQVEQAEEDFQAALAIDGMSAAAYDGVARVRARQQRLADAEAAYRKALSFAPADRTLHDALGALLVPQGRYEEAIKLFEQSIALAPDSIYGYSNLGGVYLLLGRYADAAQRFQDALKIRPTSALYTNLGTVLFAQGLYGPAATALERALSMGAGAHDYMNWANLADAYRQLPGASSKAREHYAEAIQLIDAEIEKAPRDPTLLSRRALFLAKRGDCPGADAGLRAASDGRKRSPYVRFRTAVTLEICGHRREALAELRRALDEGLAMAEIDGDPDLHALRADPANVRAEARGAGSASQPSPR